MAESGATPWPPRYYEYIVVGCGGVGSGTLYWLSKRAQSSKYPHSTGCQNAQRAVSIALYWLSKRARAWGLSL